MAVEAVGMKVMELTGAWVAYAAGAAAVRSCLWALATCAAAAALDGGRGAAAALLMTRVSVCTGRSSVVAAAEDAGITDCRAALVPPSTRCTAAPVLSFA